MGACETTPPAAHTRGDTTAPCITPANPSRLFLAPDDAPPLAGLQLVRPHPAPGGAGLRALQLDPARAAAQTGSDEEKPQPQSHPATRLPTSRSPGQATTPT